MTDEIFIGREGEIAELQAILSKKSAGLVAVKGRRRVGKTRLIEYFARNKRFYKMTGLLPLPELTAQDQRNEFSRQLAQQTGLPLLHANDWADLFSLLAREVMSGRVVLLFDEISWMADKDPTFLPKLKNAWDDYFKKNPKLILVLCSSISSWIEQNILSSKAFFGRISWTLTLYPLPLTDCNRLLDAQGFRHSDYEKFKVLSVTGGIPWYIEQIQGQLNADNNIKRQCFTEGGVLFEEYEKIFRDLFDSRSGLYKQIVEALLVKPLEAKELAEALNYPKGGRLSEYLDDLVEAGFISRDYTWLLASGNESKLSVYRLSDNYLRFYLKYIKPKINQIKSGKFKSLTLQQLPAWESIMGLQFENLVLNNRHKIYEALNINPQDIVYDNPFFQRQTVRQRGCQIDYLIQTKFNTLYVCEIKFSRRPVGRAVCLEVEEKIARLNKPRGVNCLPVLIHVSGVSDNLLATGMFYQTIDFSEFLR